MQKIKERDKERRKKERKKNWQVNLCASGRSSLFTWLRGIFVVKLRNDSSMNSFNLLLPLPVVEAGFSRRRFKYKKGKHAKINRVGRRRKRLALTRLNFCSPCHAPFNISSHFPVPLSPFKISYVFFFHFAVFYCLKTFCLFFLSKLVPINHILYIFENRQRGIQRV